MSGSFEIPLEVLEIFLEEARELLQKGVAALHGVHNETDPRVRTNLWRELKRVLHTLKGAAAAAGQNLVESATHTLEDLVPDDPPGDSRDLTPLFNGFESLEALLSETIGSGHEPTPPCPPVPADLDPPPPSNDVQASRPRSDPGPVPNPLNPTTSANTGQERLAQDWLRIPPRRVDRLEGQVSDLLLTRLRQAGVIAKLAGVRRALGKYATNQQKAQKCAASLGTSLSPSEKAHLTKLLAEQKVDLAEILQTFSDLCRELPLQHAQATLASQSVEEAIHDLRLMPVRSFFERFSATVRTTATRAGKDVRFVVDADGAEVDRSILVRLHDPLLHIIRNAIAHGLEPRDARMRHGKPREGMLKLTALSAGTHVELTVEDDGQGVDEDAVRQRARDLDLPQADTADILGLLSQPGFSTRESVTELAGRGVGLDVCVATLNELGGSLKMESEPGHGTRFTLSVPVRATAAPGLILRADGHDLGVLMSSVERVVRPESKEFSDYDGRATIELDGSKVAVTCLSELLGGLRPPAENERPSVVVLCQGKRRLGVIVDDIPDESTMIVRSLGRAFRRGQLFTGGAVQPDHSVVPILRVSTLFERASRHSTSARSPWLASALKPTLAALVVDDSITMRTLLRNILQAANYHVITAEDGVSALEKLARMSRCDVVVTDLQMPRMDGVELCRAIRSRPGGYIPVVMVTSVAAEDERRQALQAGADGYVVKASFEQQAFLKRVDNLVKGPEDTRL